ncbi:hypothetical protein [Lutibacter sp.]
MKTNLPKGLITPLEAKKLNQQFVKTRSKELNRIIGKLDNKPNKKDSLSSWFSLEELENYIAYVKEVGAKKGIDINGLRVYFGAYGKNMKNPAKNNFSTVFFVPTTAKKELIKKKTITAVSTSSDIEDIDGLNLGGTGNPPSATYPQL